MDIIMHYPNPAWPSQYEHIASQLRTDLISAKINFTDIIHIGSTSIPNLNAKPEIDILITLPPSDFFNTSVIHPLVCHALRDGNAQGGYYYIGNGGLRDRWSFKLGIRQDQDGNPMIPLRNVYVVPHGCLHHRSCVAMRDTLCLDENKSLREEYGQLKWDLAKGEYGHIWEYASKKNEVVRKVLKRAGWTDEEVDEKEAMRVVNWPEALVM